MDYISKDSGDALAVSIIFSKLIHTKIREIFKQRMSGITLGGNDSGSGVISKVSRKKKLVDACKGNGGSSTI